MALDGLSMGQRAIVKAIGAYYDREYVRIWDTYLEDTEESVNRIHRRTALRTGFWGMTILALNLLVHSPHEYLHHAQEAVRLYTELLHKKDHPRTRALLGDSEKRLKECEIQHTEMHEYYESQQYKEDEQECFLMCHEDEIEEKSRKVKKAERCDEDLCGSDVSMEVVAGAFREMSLPSKPSNIHRDGFFYKSPRLPPAAILTICSGRSDLEANVLFHNSFLLDSRSFDTKLGGTWDVFDQMYIYGMFIMQR